MRLRMAQVKLVDKAELGKSIIELKQRAERAERAAAHAEKAAHQANEQVARLTAIVEGLRLV